MALLEESSQMAVLLYRAAVDSALVTKTSCGIICVDCSHLLSADNKVSCALLTLAMATAFSKLEVPYSVVVFADYDFQFAVKTFDDPHSPTVMQRVLDAIMVDRLSPLIADACYYVKNVLNCSGRNHRAIFVISSGLDTSLFQIDEWKAHILRDNTESCGFYFYRSSHLSDENMMNIQGMWLRFREGVSSAVAFTRCVSITREDVISVSSSIREQFCAVLSPLSASASPSEKQFIRSEKMSREVIQSEPNPARCDVLNDLAWLFADHRNDLFCHRDMVKFL
jgi:hypothetical protein